MYTLGGKNVPCGRGKNVLSETKKKNGLKEAINTPFFVVLVRWMPHDHNMDRVNAFERGQPPLDVPLGRGKPLGERRAGNPTVPALNAQRF